jgi:hypothetical protein
MGNSTILGKITWKTWLVFLALSQSIFATMSLWTFPYISSRSHGLAAFDMRPFGYSPLEARDFLGSIDEAGIAFYRNIQLPLDIAYPAVMCLFMIVTFIIALKPLPGGERGNSHALSRLAGAMSLVPVIGMVGDYCENACILLMLSDPSGASGELIRLANACTLVKSSSTAISWSMAIILGALALASTLRRRRAA